MTADVLIAGAGIIGLATALELADRGLRVTVLERGEPMREASWAAAGMLAVHDPENPPALKALAEYSVALYPDFLTRVEAGSGIAVRFRTVETVQTTRGRSLCRLAELSLDPRDLGAALPRACEAARVRLLTHAEVSDVETTPEAVVVHADAGVFTARCFVDCRGAWATTATGIAPRKGQMLAVTLAPGATLEHTLRTPEIYIVPRGDGRVIVGATVEDAGFDKQVHPAAIQALFDQAVALWPPLAQGRIAETWAGLRPATPDALPIIDWAAPGIFVAAGHYRNGILLAPGTARVVADLLLDLPPAIDLRPYRAGRFGVQQHEAAHIAANDKHLTAAL